MGPLEREGERHKMILGRNYSEGEREAKAKGKCNVHMTSALKGSGVS